MASAATSRVVDGESKGAAWKRICAWVLLGVFCLGMVSSLVVLWARIEVYNTDAWVATVAPLAADPVIQEAVADRVTSLLAEQIQRDPATQSAVAGVVGAAGMSIVLEFVNRNVLEFVQSDDFQQYWITANEAVHQRTIDALTGDAEGTVFLDNGQLILDLNPAIARVEDRLRAAGLDVVDRIEIDPASATFILLESEPLQQAENAIELLDTLAIVLPIVTLLALIGCLLLSEQRGRMVTWAALGTAVSMAVFLAVLSVAENRYLNSLGAGRSVEAMAAIFETVTRGLRAAIRSTAMVGLLVAGTFALVSLDAVRQPRVVTFLSRYRAAFVGGILAIACTALVADDHVELAQAFWIGLVAVMAVAVVVWLASLPSGTAPNASV